MKLTLQILMLALISFYSFGQDSIVCSDYKNGTFKLTDPQSKKVCIITRKDNVQTERIQDSDEVYDFNITWIDDCTYTVTPTASTASRNKEMLKLGTMTVAITPATDTSYVQSIRVANSPKFRRKDTVYIVDRQENKEKRTEENIED